MRHYHEFPDVQVVLLKEITIMGIIYQNLNDRVRTLMLKEVDLDVARGRLYLSLRLSPEGKAVYEELLRDAIQYHDDDWLARELTSHGYIKRRELRTVSRGRTNVRTPRDAAMVLAEGEFNRFYSRGLCLMAIEDEIDQVEIYRGKSVTRPRSKSTSLIGELRSAKALLHDLRESQGVEPALGIPPGPNSGLTIRLPISS